MIQRGDVVLARFPFTDQTGTKIRPVLVLLEVPGQYRDFLVMFISSQRRQAIPEVDFVLEPTDPVFAGTGLKTASVFKVAKVAALSEALLIGAIGRLDDALFKKLIKRLVRLLQTGRLP
jgi:mRNA interferase MazF